MVTRITLLSVIVITTACQLTLGDDPALQPQALEQLREQARQNELLHRQYEEQQQRIDRIRKDFFDTVEETHALLTDLLAKTQALVQQMETLRSNDEGKRIAAQDKAFMTFLDLKEHPAVRLNQVQRRLDATAAIRDNLQQEKTRVAVGFLPSKEVQAEVYDIRSWAKEHLAALIVQQDTLNRLVPIDSPEQDPNHLQTLAEAIEQHHADVYNNRLRDKILGQQLAEEKSHQIIVDAAYVAHLRETQASAEYIRNETDMKIAQMNVDHQLELRRVTQEHAKALADAERRHDDLMAQLEELRKDAKVNREVKAIEGKMQREAKLSAAIHEEHLARAQRPEVKRLLAPFISDGYLQPPRGKIGDVKGPVSIQGLKESGALQRDTKGRKKLLYWATMNRDKSRPRWPYKGYYSQLSSDKLDKIILAQEYLIELGDALEELGLLAP